jgi:hypothetical protein
VASGVSEAVGYLFQALDPSAEPELFSTLETKILTFFKRSSPINAVKVSAKLIESVVNGNPASLPRVLEVLIDSDIATGNCSAEKLAFRLRLAGGAVRSAQGVHIVPVLSILRPFFEPQYTTLHTEKAVRKAAGKLLKDTLKGLTSFYPTGIRPMAADGSVPLGASNEHFKVHN